MFVVDHVLESSLTYLSTSPSLLQTIGDSYVAVSGLPDPRKDHAGKWSCMLLSNSLFVLVDAINQSMNLSMDACILTPFLF